MAKDVARGLRVQNDKINIKNKRGIKYISRLQGIFSNNCLLWNYLLLLKMITSSVIL